MTTSPALHFIRATCLTALIALAGASEAALTKVVVALKPDKNPEAMAGERKELAAALGARLGLPVEVIVPMSGAVLMEGLTNGSVDLGWLASTDVAKLPPPRPVGVLLAARLKGETSYRSVWLTLKERTYASPADLRGRPVAFASKTSTSGCIVPLHDLVQKGLVTVGGGPEGFFGKGNCWYGTGYVSAVERVLAGEAEAAAVSDYVYDGGKHLTAEQKDRLRVLASQGPVPTHVLGVRTSLATGERDRLRMAVLQLEPALRNRVFGGELIQVDEAAHLAPIAAALATVQAMKL
jgi:phosphonate transport system substrate-binding protein